jgi:hypothetical protein
MVTDPEAATMTDTDDDIDLRPLRFAVFAALDRGAHPTTVRAEVDDAIADWRRTP